MSADADLASLNDQPRHAFEAARLRLARLHRDGSLREEFCELAGIVSQALDVERVGLWLLTDDGSAICCLCLAQRSSDEVFEGAVLHAQDFPTYFEALQAKRVIPAADARTHPLTHELREAYLDPLGVTSMLDAPIYREGKVIGVVCHESVGDVRVWTGADYDFASTVADTLARLIEEDARHRAEASLAAYETRLMELRRFEALGKVAAGVAHDFRSILRAVMGFSGLILSSPGVGDTVAGYARRIQDAAARGDTLTSELVSFSKETRNAPRVLDVAEAVRSLETMLRMLAGAGIELSIHTAPTLSRVLIDRSQLERAIVNLVVNARDATSGSGRIRLTIAEETPEASDTAYVVISVADDGSGMDTVVRERMFEPFFTTKGEKGTGLGLAVVSQIVSHAGGFIRVDSEPGRGTTVKLYLPRIARHD